jgi:hypothetical protein
MATDRNKMPCNVIANYVERGKKLQEQKRIVGTLKTTIQILKGMKKRLTNHDIRIAVPEILPSASLLAEIKLLSGYLEEQWKSRRNSLARKCKF